MREWGAKIAALAPGYCSLEMPIGETHLQHLGFVNGGVLAAIADNVCGLAFTSLLPADRAPLTVEFKINFVAPTQGEKIISYARVVKMGKTLGVVEARLCGVDKNGQEKLGAVVLMTSIAVARPPIAE